MREGTITVTLTQDELCWVSLALDKFAADLTNVNALDEPSVTRTQQRFDRLYRGYHNLRDAGATSASFGGGEVA